jgi:phenylacetate-CoA ligase
MSMYPDETLESLRRQLTRAAEYDLYGDRFAEAGVDPEAVDSWEAFRTLPYMTAADLVDDRTAHEPEGSLAPDGTMLSFTPADEELFPVFDTAEDLSHQIEVHQSIFERIGVTDDDRVLNAFGYHLFGTGILLHRGLEAVGAEVIPAGPGDSEQAADVIKEYDVDILVGNPSYALKIGQQGASVDIFVGGGEPFTSIPGLRDDVRTMLGCETAVDYFGTRRAAPVAAECRSEDGLHVVLENVVVEVIDPDTGEVLSPGERGELVVTHVEKQGTPLVRYRTGDLAELRVESCPTCGASVTLPEGVIGRTDDRLKVKGVKVYPGSIGTVLAGTEGLTGEYRLEVTRPESTDHLRLVCKGDPAVSVEELREAVTERLLVAPDEFEVVEELEGEAGTFDERY